MSQQQLYRYTVNYNGYEFSFNAHKDPTKDDIHRMYVDNVLRQQESNISIPRLDIGYLENDDERADVNANTNISFESDQQYKDATWMQRFTESAKLAAIPHFGTMQSQYSPADESSELWAEALGGLGGAVVGMIPFSLVTGGIGTIGSATKVASKFKTFNNLVEQSNKLKKLGKTAQAAKKQKKAEALLKKYNDVFERAITKNEYYNPSGLLGQIKPYRNTILKLADKNPYHARALNLFANNIGAFTMYGQSKLPYDRLEGRLNQLGADAAASVVFSVAGLPTMYGYTSKGIKYGVEPLSLLGAGMYSDLGQSDMTLEERLIHGLGLVGFHYGRQQLSKLNIKSKMSTALRLSNPELSDARLNSIMDTPGMDRLVKGILDKSIEKPFYTDRKKPQRQVELLRVVEKDDGNYQIMYRDINSGQPFGITGSSRTEALQSFNKVFSKNVPDVQSPVKSRNLTPEEKIALKELQIKEKELRDAMDSSRSYEVVEDVRSSIETVVNPFKETKGINEVDVWRNKTRDARQRIEDAKNQYSLDLQEGKLNPNVAKSRYSSELVKAQKQLSIAEKKLDEAYKGVSTTETSEYVIPVGGVKRFKTGDYVRIPKYDVNTRQLDYSKAGIGRYLGTLSSFNKTARQEIIMPDWMRSEPTRYTNLFKDVSVFEIKTHGGSRVAKVAIAGKMPKKVYESIQKANRSERPILEYLETSKEGKPFFDNPIVKQERRPVREDLGGGFSSTSYQEVGIFNVNSPIFKELFSKRKPRGGIKPENIRTVEAESRGTVEPVGNIVKALKETGIKDNVKGDFVKGAGQFSIAEKNKVTGYTAEENIRNLVRMVMDYNRAWSENQAGIFGAKTKKPYETAMFQEIYKEAVQSGYKKSAKTFYNEFGPGGKIQQLVSPTPVERVVTDTYYQYSPTTIKKLKLSDGKPAFPDGIVTPELARAYEINRMESLGKKLEKRRDEERSKFAQLKDANVNQWPDMNRMDRKAKIDAEVFESYPEFNPVNDKPWTVHAKWDSRSQNKIETKTRVLMNKGEVARFKNKEEAEIFARDKWLNPDAVEMQIINAIDRISNIKGPEVQKFQFQQKQLKKAQKEANIPQEEYNYILRELFPESLGSSNDMTAEQVKFATAFLSPSGNTKVYQDKMTSIVPPADMINRTKTRFQKFLHAVADYSLPASSYHFMSRSKTAEQRGLNMIYHELLRQEINGTGSEFITNMMKHFRMKRKDFDKLSSVIEPKFKEFYDKKLDKYDVESAAEYFQNFKDTILAELLIPNNMSVRVGSKANAPYEDLFAVYDRFNKKIDLAVGWDALRLLDMVKFRDSNGSTKNPALPATRDVMRDGKWIKVPETGKIIPTEYFYSLRRLNSDTGKYEGGWYIDGKNRYVVSWSDKNTYTVKKIGSDKVEVKNPASEASRFVKIYNREGTPNKFNHHIERNYLTRILTDEFRDLMSTNTKFFDGVAWVVSRTDPSIRSMAGSAREKHDAAKQYLTNSTKLWQDKAGVYGTQYARVADLPPMMAFEKGTNYVIELANMKDVNGNIVKKGSQVIDKNGNKKTVGKTVDVYERNLSKILPIYFQKIAHIVPTTKFFGKRGAESARQQEIYEKIRRETDEAFANWSQETLSLQLNAIQKETRFDKVARNLTIVTAQLGLSGPTAGYKNLILGQSSNATVFGFREALNGLSRTLASPRELSSLTGKLGGKEAGVHELMTGRVAYSKYNPGMMRPTEIVNRMSGIAIGEPALKTAIDNLNGIKNVMNIGVSKETSMRTMTDVFKMTDRQIADAVRLGSERIYERPDLIKQAEQMAHLITQGGPSLPFVPRWMGKNWAKPLTLFYRVAYRMSENIANSVIKPLVVDGNPVPMMRYLTLLPIAGKAIFTGHYFATGEQRENQFKKDMDKYFELALKAEGVGIFSNAFNEYGNAVESYTPAVYNTLKTLGTNFWAGLTGKKTVPQSLEDMSRDGIVFFNQLLRRIERSAKPSLTAQRDSRRRQRQFNKVYFRDKPYLGGELENLTRRSPHYRMVAAAFWTDDPEEKAKIFYAARNFIMQDELNKNPSLIKSPYKAMKLANKNLKTLISAQRPIPSSWRKKTEGAKTRYELYMSKITPEQRKEEMSIENEYKRLLREWNSSISRYRDKYSKDPWMAPNDKASTPPTRQQVIR